MSTRAISLDSIFFHFHMLIFCIRYESEGFHLFKMLNFMCVQFHATLHMMLEQESSYSFSGAAFCWFCRRMVNNAHKSINFTLNNYHTVSSHNQCNVIQCKCLLMTTFSMCIVLIHNENRLSSMLSNQKVLNASQNAIWCSSKTSSHPSAFDVMHCCRCELFEIIVDLRQCHVANNHNRKQLQQIQLVRINYDNVNNKTFSMFASLYPQDCTNSLAINFP